jgi:pimeloyl-ACP methyl ester carboxylesterase
MEHLGIEQAGIVGYSMGGSVALQVSIQHPDRVRSSQKLKRLDAEEIAWPSVPPDRRFLDPIIASCPYCRGAVPPVPCAHVRAESQFASGAVLSPGGHDGDGRDRP